jgi:hypothetical protein
MCRPGNVKSITRRTRSYGSGPMRDTSTRRPRPTLTTASTPSPPTTNARSPLPRASSGPRSPGECGRGGDGPIGVTPDLRNAPAGAQESRPDAAPRPAPAESQSAQVRGANELPGWSRDRQRLEKIKRLNVQRNRVRQRKEAQPSPVLCLTRFLRTPMVLLSRSAGAATPRRRRRAAGRRHRASSSAAWRSWRAARREKPGRPSSPPSRPAPPATTGRTCP